VSKLDANSGSESNDVDKQQLCLRLQRHTCARSSKAAELIRVLIRASAKE